MLHFVPSESDGYSANMTRKTLFIYLLAEK